MNKSQIALKKSDDNAEKTPEKKTYTANADGWIAGVRRKKGDPVSLTPKQAKYENVTLVPDESNSAKAGSDDAADGKPAKK